ncbi:ATP-grasp fold amidoligase family protein [Brachyspira hyodysenteriae]|uniref:ATP-grasp fold amidoligase family protein n=1 Tax=Brachyspira hyodysenteriae TaxID=159 RepID=UPI0022CD3015|nr:ATP-grasp fold amidoligase family protein [Brachyspira hyodysenteriae]MCZ9874328.1 glycosyl transferase [Brachyspira hyodysenteriae]
MTPEENIKFRETITKNIFKSHVGYEPNLENPKTFNEKLQWLKLYYHDPLMTICADKYLVRDYVKEKIGEEYLVPLIGVWDRVEDIDFDSLPNQFVLKVNWGSGQNIIVKDKSTLNIEETKNKLEYWMKPTSNHYYYIYEWPYKNIKPKILAEKYVMDENLNNLTVYKTFCFNSEPYLFQVIINDKTPDEKINYYDLNWNKLILKQNYQNFDYDLKKPEALNLMIDIAKKISKDFPYFIRIDFYQINEKIYFSEYTFYSDAGIAKFEPEEWDIKLGNIMTIPKNKKIEYDFIDRETLINQAANLEPIVKQYRDLEENYNKLKPLEEKIKLYSKKFNLFTIFNIDILSFTSNKEYFIFTILGIKIVFKHKVRPDQTRPDQTRPDQTRPNIYICSDYILLYNNTKYKKLQPMLQYPIAA